MLRILHVVTYMGRGGLETMLMNYYRNIDRSKIQFDFLVHRDFKADYDEEIEKLGGKIYRLPKLNPFSKTYLNALDNFFKEHKEYKIIHVHQDCLSSIACKYALKNGVPIRIAHSHSSNQDKNIKYLLKMYFMKKIPKYANYLIACGEEAGNWMFNGEKYLILNNAIDSKKFRYNYNQYISTRKKLNIKDNQILFGHVGRFNYPKNHIFLIDIFNEIYIKENNAILMLIGVGDLQDSIKDKVTKLGLTDVVKFMGNRSDVNELMQAMDVFVFPSNYEGLPVTLVEAQASGLPIFKSNNVPDQCIMTNNIESLSLDLSPEIWATKILDYIKDFKRVDTYECIKKANFDIVENAKWLEEFYLNEVSKHA